jgi:O-antigen/teichoic acid export membrane protein
MTLLMVFACLRYEQAILCAEDEHDALKLFQLCVITALLVSLIVMAVGAALSLISNADALEHGVAFWWYGPATFACGTLLAAQALLTRLKLFRASAGSKIVQSGSNGLISIGLSFVLATAGGLILSDIASRLFGVLFAVRGLFQAGLERLSDADPKELARLASHFSRFPRISVLGGLLNNGATFLTPAALLFIYGAQATGQYALADRSIGLPLGLVVISVSQVFAAQFGHVLREQPNLALRYFRRLIATAAGVAIAPAALGAYLAPWLFPAVFGGEWGEAGHFAQILALGYFSAAVMGPVNAALVVMQRLNQQLLWEAGRLLVFAGVWIMAFAERMTAASALMTFSMGTLAVNIAFVLIVDRQLAGADRYSRGTFHR